MTTTLGEICARVGTIQPQDSPDAEFTYFDIGGIDSQSNRIVNTKTFLGRESPSRARQSVRKGDILFSTVRTYLKKIARIEKDYPNPVASTGFTVLRAAERVLPNFLFSQVLSEEFLQPLHRLQSGSSYPAVRDKDVFAQPIRLAPTREQERIVAKLEALLSQVAVGEAAARRALNSLQRYRAAVLHNAVTGELTSDWRKTHLPGETALQLLKRLFTERRARWEETELKRFHTAGRRPKDDKWKKRYCEPTSLETAGLLRLPKSWIWCSSDTIFSFVTSGSRGWAKYYSKKGALFLRVGDLAHENIKIDTSRIQRVKPPATTEGVRTLVQANDILISITADVGMVGLVPEGLGKAYVNQHLALARPLPGISAAFVAYYLSSSRGGWGYLRKNERGMTKGGLSLDDVKGIPFPLPPFNEQIQIVSEIERRLAAADRLSQTVRSQLERASLARQSLLREAFAGNLVPQNPDDEPASVLLKHIRSAREAEANEPKTKRMPKSKFKIVRRPVLEVLRERKRLSPEELFREAGFQPSEADAFYRELSALRGFLREKKPTGTQARAWPTRAKVLLELREH